MSTSNPSLPSIGNSFNVLANPIVMTNQLGSYASSSHHPMVAQARNNISKPKQYTDGTIKYPIHDALLSTADPALLEPTWFSSAVKIPKWRKAMQDEFNALLNNQTWTLVHPSSAKNVVDYKWIFKLKRRADGSVERHKA